MATFHSGKDVFGRNRIVACAMHCEGISSTFIAFDRTRIHFGNVDVTGAALIADRSGISTLSITPAFLMGTEAALLPVQGLRKS